jgi:hypothetical protein
MFHSLQNGVSVSSQLTDILVMCKPSIYSRRVFVTGIRDLDATTTNSLEPSPGFPTLLEFPSREY